VKSLWRPIDAIGDWIVNEFDSKKQMRLGVILFLGSIPFYPYLFWSGEPPVIYFLSVLAVTLTGLGILVGLQVLVKQEQIEESNEH
jgi:hypothetical protein